MLSNVCAAGGEGERGRDSKAAEEEERLESKGEESVVLVGRCRDISVATASSLSSSDVKDRVSSRSFFNSAAVFLRAIEREGRKGEEVVL